MAGSRDARIRDAQAVPGRLIVQRATDPRYLLEQYGTTDRLRIRIETHQLYSERTDDFLAWALDHLDPRPGDLVLDPFSGGNREETAIAQQALRR